MDCDAHLVVKESFARLAEWDRIAAFCVLGVALILIYTGLDNAYLDGEEAIHANLASSTLSNGYPLGQIGRHFIGVCDGGNATNTSMVWINHSWLPYYVNAFVFRIFGKTTWTARAAPALVGVLALIVLWWTMRRFAGRRAGLLALVLTAFNVQFLLYARTNGYVSWVMFGAVLSLAGYRRILNDRRHGGWLFAGAMVLLFHCQYAFFFCLLPGYLLHMVVWGRTAARRRLLPLVPAFAAMLLLTIPWLVYVRYDAVARNACSLSRVPGHAMVYFWKSQVYFSPFAAVAVVGGLVRAVGGRVRLRRRFRRPAPVGSARCAGRASRINPYSPGALLLVLIVVFIVCISWLVYPFSTRYIAPLLPLSTGLAAVLLDALGRRTKVVMAAGVATIVSSNALHVLPYAALRALDVDRDRLFLIASPLNDNRNNELFVTPVSTFVRDHVKIRCFLAEFLYEIAHDYDGPNEGVAKYINRHAADDDTVICGGIEADVLFFYTGLAPVNRCRSGDATDASSPTAGMLYGDVCPNRQRIANESYCPDEQIDWVAPRKSLPQCSPAFTDPHFLRHNRDRYARIVLDYPDIPMENWPDLYNHFFRTRTDGERVEIWRRKRE